MDVRASGPAEPEEADWDEKGANERGLQADLGADVTVLIHLWLDVLVVEVEEGAHDDDGAEEDADEGEALGAEGEVVDLDEDDGEGFEPEVEEAVDEADV